MIKAIIIKDSISKNNTRITTYILTYPRFIHSEFLTHRVFSRNASSSRAIPVKKQIKMVANNMAIPLVFAANKSGMQAGEKFGPLKQKLCVTIWKTAGYCAIFFATLMEKLNIHKQYANRILEPFNHITVVCTATDYENFFALRCHPDAQPEIQELANQMYEAITTQKPRVLEIGGWHLPFVTDMELEKIGLENALKCSAARCARTSFLNHDNKRPGLIEDLALYDRLVGRAPIHASPTEHQAMATYIAGTGYSGNFRNWVQYRKTLVNENVEKFTKL